MNIRNPLRIVTTFGALVALAVFLGACAMGGTQVEATSYALGSTGAGGTNVSGTVTFTKVSDTSTEISIALTGTPAGGMHPAHIHVGDANPGGGIYVTLGTVDGTTGASTITVTETDAMAAITYEDLVAYDGYVNVHLSAAEIATVVAQGEVGAGATPVAE